MLRIDQPARGWAGATLLIVVLATVAIGFAGWNYYCPCERMPGGYLFGTEVSEPIEDWEFANEVPLCQIQVDDGLLPHSINLNCMADAGVLYLSCASCDGKHWSTAVLANPAARLRMNDLVYPVTVTRVTESAELDQAWVAREAKLGRPTDRPRQDGWWSFRVTSR